MKKTLTISFSEGDYTISDGTNKVVILGTDLILNGQDLFDKFYKDFNKKDCFEVTVLIDPSVVDSKDKYIAGEIKKILEEINTKLSSESENNTCINVNESPDLKEKDITSMTETKERLETNVVNDDDCPF